MNLLLDRIDASAILDLQTKQYPDKMLISDTVPLGQSKLGSADVGNLGHFLCMKITGHFTTMKSGPTDDGVSHLRGLLSDGTGQRKLFSDYVPLDLWLSPGRVKSPLDLTGADSNNLFYPLKWEYLFAANGAILLDVKNDSDLDNDYEVTFHGYRIKSKIAVQGV